MGLTPQLTLSPSPSLSLPKFSLYPSLPFSLAKLRQVLVAIVLPLFLVSLLCSFYLFETHSFSLIADLTAKTRSMATTEKWATRAGGMILEDAE